MSLLIKNKSNLPEMGNASLKIIKEWSFDKICKTTEQTVLNNTGN
jgi:hypothetical protein